MDFAVFRVKYKNILFSLPSSFCDDHFCSQLIESSPQIFIFQFYTNFAVAASSSSNS